MAIQLHGLRTVIYPVSDIEAATLWWSQVIGHPPYFEESFYVGFEVGGYELGLLADGNPSDGAITYWGVDDVAAAMGDLIAVGASVHVAASEVGDDIVTGSIRTPDGHILGLIYNPHFKAE